MPSVGTAYVNIRVNTKGFEAGLDSALKKMTGKMEVAGRQLGRSMTSELRSTDWNEGFKGLPEAAGKASTKAANSIKKVQEKVLDLAISGNDAGNNIKRGLDAADKSAKKLSGSLSEVKREGRGAGRAVGGVGGGGGGGGSGMRAAGGDASFLGSQLSKLAAAAPQAERLLAKLYNTAAFGGTAMAALVGAASAAGQAIFAIGANAASAAPALATMTSGIIGLAQVGSVLGLAMQGAGGALTAGFDAAEKSAVGATSAVTGMGEATAAASRAVRDAKQALQQAYDDAADAARDAARQTADAERALAEAQQETAAAQRELNLAREEALEQIEDIGFAAEDAAIAEDRAALSLIDARRELKAVSELAPNDRARVEAELNFQEAELQFRMAKDRRQDTVKDQREVAKKGVEGTDAMRDARDNLASAEENEADALRDLADARRNEAEVAEDNAQSIADAQQNLADAQHDLTQAQRQGTEAMQAATDATDEYQTALEKLGPNAAEFVDRIVKMKEAFEAFRNRVSEPLFGSLLTAMDTIENSNLLGIIEEGLTGTATALGKVAEKAAKVATSGAFKKSLGNTMASNNKAIENFGNGGVYLADAFVQVADAAGPLLRRFSRWAEEVGKAASETARAENRSGDLTKTINSAGDTVAEWWELLKEVYNTLKLVGGAANNAMNQFNDGKGYIPTATANLKEWNKNADKKKLTEDFGQALKNFNAAAKAVKTVLKPIIELGSDPALETMFNTISRSEAFDKLGDAALDAAPAMAELVDALLDIVAVFSESGGIQLFMETLAGALGLVRDVLEKIAGNKYGQVFLGIAAGVFAVNRAIKLMKGVVKTLIAGTIGPLITKLSTAFKPRTAKLSATTDTAAVAGGRVAEAGEEAGDDTWQANVLRGLTAIKLAVDACCVKLSAAMSGMAAGEAVEGASDIRGAAPAVGGAVDPFAKAAPAAATTSKFGKLGAIFGKLGPLMSKLGPLTKILSGGMRVLGVAFRFMLGPVGMIVLTVLPLLWPLLVKLEEKTGIFSKTLDVLTGAFKWLWDKLKEGFNWVKDNWDLLLAILFGPFGLAVRWIIQNWDMLMEFVKGVPAKIKGFLSNMWDVITDKLGDAWDWVRRTVGRIVNWVKGVPRRVWNALKNLWEVIKDKLGDAWDWVKRTWGRIVAWVKYRPTQFMINLRALWDVVKDKLGDAWDWVKDTWDRIVTWVKDRPAQFARTLAKLWDVVKDKLADAWNWVQNKWDDIRNAISNWPGQIKDKLNDIWNGMGQGLVSAVNWVGDKVNWLIDKINGVTDKFGGPHISVSWPKLAWTGFAEGGPVQGPGGPKGDKIPAMLSNGEYIMPTAATKGLGRPALDYMRKHGELPVGDPGIFSSVVHTVSSIGGAVAKGAETAVKWVLGKVVGWVEGHTLIGDIVASLLEYAADKFTSWGEDKDEEIAERARRRAARAGGGDVVVPDPSNPSGHRSWKGGIFTNRMLAHMQKAEKLANVAIQVMQGGFRPQTSYSGTSHQGDAIDLQVSYALIRALRRVGIAAGDRTGLGSWAPHVHAVPGPRAGYAAGSAIWQFQDYVARGGASQSMRSPWGLAKGGVVAPSAAGTLALIAEAGRPERVTPLDSEGFSPAERQMLAVLEENLNGGGGDQYHVHPAAGMDETALADKVARRVAWKRRRGAGWR